MAGKIKDNNKTGELRKQAEKVARQKALVAPEDFQSLSPEAAGKLVHELRVHQIELEVQNEELRAAQEKLEESRTQYFELYDLAPVGYFSISEQGIILEANLTGANLLGVMPGELRTQRFSRFILKDDQDIYYLGRKQLFETRVPQLCEIRMVCRGAPFWVRVDAVLARDGKSGKAVCHLTVNDITAQKTSDALLRVAEAQYRLLSGHVTDTVWTMDMDLKITYQSASVQKLRGFTPAEIRDMPFEQHVTPESLKLVSEVLSKELPGVQGDAHYNPVLTLELEYCCKDGSTVWTENKLSVIRDVSGRPVSVLGESRDITERKIMEEVLRLSEEKYRTVVENALEAIFIAVDGQIIFANRSIEILTGYTVQEITSRPFVEFIHPDDRDMVIGRHLGRLKGEDIPNIYSFRIVSKAGNIKWVELSAVMINWEGRLAVLNFLSDITDRNRLEEEQQRVDKLEAVGLLAGGIAHDFNNILTAILGNISLAGSEASPGSELSESLQQAEKASLRAKALTMQLLTFSKGGAPVKKITSLTPLIRDTASFALSGSNVKCKFSMPDDLWHAEVDPGQVSQVIHNLVINAQQAMPTGGSIEIGAENMALSETHGLGRGLPVKAGNYIRISVADHGTGVPRDHLEKIFDPFFTTKQKGNGMGLAVSFSIARQHGGHLSVESELGAGSTFFLYLPASAEIVTPKPAKKMTAKAMGTARILVMDDEPGVRKISVRMLKHLGYDDIVLAEDGAAAIKLYAEAMESGRPFTLVILDLTVPGGMGGEAAVRHLLKIDPEVRSIVSSGYIEDPVMANYADYGFNGVVAKPYTIAELGKAVQMVIGQA